MNESNEVFVGVLSRILRPLVRITLRHGVTFEAFAELLRRTYVDVAEREFAVAGRKQTTARISVLTGLNRKDVARTKKLPPPEEISLDEHHNRAARVISGWLRDAQFRDRKGDPDALPMEGERSFHALVKRYSGDMPPRTVADELLRVGAVEFTPHGDLRLSARGYVPGEGQAEMLHMLGTDVRDLIETIDHNLTHDADERLFQRKVVYDNLPAAHAAEFRRLSARLGQSVLEQLNDWLAERDRDTVRGTRGGGRVRLGLGIFQLEHGVAAAAPRKGRRRT